MTFPSCSGMSSDNSPNSGKAPVHLQGTWFVELNYSSFIRKHASYERPGNKDTQCDWGREELQSFHALHISFQNITPRDSPNQEVPNPVFKS